jgi:hypothetical protein
MIFMMPSNWELRVIIVFYSYPFHKAIQLGASGDHHFYSDGFQEAIQLGATGDHSSLILIVFRKMSDWELWNDHRLLF